jgi:hypothetical protein
MYYAGVAADSWDPYPVDGYQTNPVAPNTSNDLFPAFYFNGTSACPATRTQLTGVNSPCGWPQGSIILPPQLRGDVANGGNPVGVSPKNYLPPRYQNWSVSFQRQLSQNMGIDIAYVGNHGTRLFDGRSSGGVYDNMNPASVLQFGTALTSGAFSCATPPCSASNPTTPNAAAIAAGFATPPYPTFTGDLAQALRPWPQYQIINWRFFSYGSSHYNALQVAFDRRMAAGLQLKVSYTYSRLINNGAEQGLGAGGPPVQNPSNMSNLTSVSSDDVPNILSLGWVYKLPFGKGKPLGGSASGFVDKFIGGWQLSGIQSYSSGRPLSITMPNNLSGILFNSARFPNKVGSGLSGHFSNPRTDSYLNPAGWADPGLTANGVPVFGNALRTDASVRGFRYFNEDISLTKDTYFGEEKYVRFHADAGNALNRVFYCPVGQTFGGGGFGTTGSQCNIPRRMQLALELIF